MKAVAFMKNMFITTGIAALIFAIETDVVFLAVMSLLNWLLLHLFR